MESYGFNSVLSMGNQHNENILRTNELIRQSNAARLKQRQQDITKEKNSQSNLEGEEVKGLAETIGGQVASKGKDIQVLPKVAGALPDIAGATLRGTEKYGIGGVDAVVNSVSKQVPRLFGEKAMATTGDNSTFGNLLKSDEELAKGGDLKASMRLASGEGAGKGIKDLGDFLKSNVSVGENIGEKASSIGKLGIASTGLSVGLGALDAIDDLESGKIEGNNAAERVANVAGMVSGGLEAAGTALDLTGVGAPVGVALNLLGGLAGLAGGVSDIIGEEEEKQKSATQQKTLQKAPVPQEKLQSLVATGTSGADVKSAQ
tara:strand:+ start:4229 stop:5182 length:954 start_codon:yes stop_codon:yes gene_type:complete